MNGGTLLFTDTGMNLIKLALRHCWYYEVWSCINGAKLRNDISQ